MTLDELTQKAGNVLLAGGDLRAAVLAVLAEVREMVPAHDDDPIDPWEDGYEGACAEMLRRLDAITGGK